MNFLYDPHEAGPEAPPRIEIAVLQAFRRHHRARKIQRFVFVSLAGAAAAACIISFMRVPPSVVDRPAPAVVHAVPPKAAWTMPRMAVASMPVRKPAHKLRRNLLAAKQFVALPFGDDSLMDESATVVRIELPRSALRLAGFTVAQEHANDLVQADVVLGPDGLAHAVRFVEY